ncbi:PGF-pre-PGF domain-containing protein [Methanosarcina sp. MSH10X1]|uniref:PGF-pre-PGF domain-containing protein n=1 Tax=Methanosarcina sp. MSH10X1 TaxID=2507075 RepID=UPI000FFBCBDE|nr:PGF-pre-PGF domain-containing protein [Methanosarcina sp. MSH10X1]RXA20121.1 PGF-pre-PGF domain-containing protein [Methanosarcina sp. MSH10X1]
MNITRVFRTKSRIKLSGFVSGLALIFLLVWMAFPASAAGIEANREISVGTVYPGESFVVTVHIKAEHELEALKLDEDLPDGWQADQLENDGTMFQNISTFKASTLEWIWVENLSAGKERTVVYNVTVPLNSQPGNFTISGAVSAYSVPAAPVEGSSEVILTCPSLEVDFSANPLTGAAPLIVRFTDLSAPVPDSWEWDFDGNGSIDSKERNPVYTYENPGTYTVTLKAINSTYGNNTRTKTGYITVSEKSPAPEGNGEYKGSGGSGGGGSGGGAGSPESTRNIELKEVSNEQVFKGTHTCFTFKGGMNEIVSVEFDPKRNFGKTTAIVEILKNRSSIVKEPAPGKVYRNVNIWIGNSGFSSPENLENAVINFRVSRDWITEQGVSENTVTLYRYSKDSWRPLPAALTGENENYFYFTAETPGFSPFAISSTEEKIQSVEISPARIRENQALNEEKISDREKVPEEVKQGTPASNMEKEESSPGFEAAFAAAELMFLYVVLKKRM